MLERNRSVFVWSPVLLSAVSHTLESGRALYLFYHSESAALYLRSHHRNLILWLGLESTLKIQSPCHHPHWIRLLRVKKTEWFTLVVSSPTTSLSRMRSLYVTGAVSISYSVGLAAVCKTAGLLRKPYSGSERY